MSTSAPEVRMSKISNGGLGDLKMALREILGDGEDAVLAKSWLTTNNKDRIAGATASCAENAAGGEGAEGRCSGGKKGRKSRDAVARRCIKMDIGSSYNGIA